MKRNLNIFPLLVILVSIFWSCSSGNGRESSVGSDTTGYYQEKYRPQFHFSPEANWMNDPNGLVFFDGEYHLFYQHFPDSTVWGPMHWGHAVGHDLVHWTHMPVALYPDSLGYIFSGSAVVDKENTAGFGNGDNSVIVAIFTYHNQKSEGSGSDTFQSQGIAYSTDKGRTWTKYSGNPVLPNPGKRDFRDPKVFWYEDTGRWIMILAVHDRVQIYSSPDLKSWSFESEFGENAGAHGGVWECPDLFPLKIEGSDSTKWIILVSINPGGPNDGSATQYFTGSFDGHAFIPDVTNEKWLDWGTDNYAGVTWSDIPEVDDRRLFIGWMSNWNYATVVPTSVWRSAMTIPRELCLRSEKGQHYLISRPAHELNNLRKKSETITLRQSGKPGEREIPLKGHILIRCELKFDIIIPPGYTDSLGVILLNNAGEKFIIGYSGNRKQFFIDRTQSGDSVFSNRFAGVATAPYEANDRLRMHLFIDASSAELFIDDGKLVMTSLFFPTENYSKLKVFSGGVNTLFENVEFHELDRIWR